MKWVCRGWEAGELRGVQEPSFQQWRGNPNDEEGGKDRSKEHCMICFGR